MENNKSNTKISGYLEKKGKNMLGSYKKYWFVLEGGLLVYYRSKLEYDNISPCKGCINLGPPCNIKPLHSTTGAFQLQTRTSTITLRAVTREEQNRWMQAIMSEINPNKPQQRMSHFRYSLDELPQVKEQPESDDKVTNSEEEPPANTQLHDAIIQRLQKMRGQSYVNPSIATKTATLERDTQAVSQEHQQKNIQKLESSTHFRLNIFRTPLRTNNSKSQNKSFYFLQGKLQTGLKKSKSFQEGIKHRPDQIVRKSTDYFYFRK
ncbi:hypothetical protein JTB14_006008 [Gonioctena quinquepunctata]|nr:hypothetical protein JTB14_006008 [Gonioctena quinquepunctata]